MDYRIVSRIVDVYCDHYVVRTNNSYESQIARDEWLVRFAGLLLTITPTITHDLVGV